MNPEKQKQTNVIIGRTLRYTLLSGLLFGVYTETGIWTTLMFILVLIESELKTYLMSKISESQLWVTSIVMRIVQKFQEAQDENNKEE